MIAVETLNLMGFILSMALLGYSAYTDLWIREAPNSVWAIYLPAASAILGFKLFLSPQLLIMSLISIAVMVGLSLLMFFIGLFGGADCKAFMCLSVALPTYPFHFESLLSSFNPMFPLTVLYTTYFLSLSTIFYVVLKNLEWKYRKSKDLFKDLEATATSKRVIALLTGYKTNFETL